MSKAKSPRRISPEAFFQRNYFAFSSASELLPRLNSLLLYLIDLEELPSLESRKPFYFLLETFIHKREYFEIKDPEIAVPLALIAIQLMRLINLDLRQTNESVFRIFAFLASSLDLALKAPSKVEMSRIYFLFESLTTTQVFSILAKDPALFQDCTEDFLRIFFDCEEFFTLEPEILKLVEKSLCEHFLNIEGLHEKLFFLMNLAILGKRDKPRVFELTRNLIETGSLKFRLGFARFEISVFQGKKALKIKDFSLPKILYVIQKIFKIDQELLIDVVKFIESAIFDPKSEIPDSQIQLFLILIGQISQLKNSRIFELFPKVFREFASALLKKQYQKIRYEIAKNIRKFLRNHQSEDGFLKKTQEMHDFIEDTLIEFLFNGADKDWSVKLFLFRSFEEDCRKYPSLFSERFYRSVLAKSITQGFFLKERLFSWLLAIYDHFCMNLYRKGVFSWRSLDFSDENEGFFDSERSTALKFEFLLQEFLNLGFKLQKNDSGLLVFLFDSLHSSRNFSIKGLIGIHFAILEKTMKEGFLIDKNEKLYQRFLYNTLGMNWRVFYERMMVFESVLLEKSWDRTLKLKEKLPSLARKRFLEENSKENINFLDFKLGKYFGSVEKIVESLEKVLKEDSNAYGFVAKLMRQETNEEKPWIATQRSQDNEEENLDLSIDTSEKPSPANPISEKEEAFDFFLRKIKQDNVHFLMKTWFSPEFFWGPASEREWLGEIQSRIFSERSKTSDVLVVIAALDLLVSLKKRLKINFSEKLTTEIFRMLEKTHKIVYPNIDPERSQLFIEIIKTRLLKILTLAKLNKNFPKTLNAGEVKDFFLEMVRDRKTKPNHAKNLAILVIQLDDVTPSKDFKHLFRDAYRDIFDEGKSELLSLNLKIFRVYCKDSLLYQEKLEFFLRNPDFFGFIRRVMLDESELKNKGFIISQWTLMKMDVCSIMHHLLYLKDPDPDPELLDLYKSVEKDWKTVLIELISLRVSKTAEIESGFIRIMAMKFFFMACLSKNKEISRQPLNFLRLSLVCFEENLETRKILFSFLIKFSSFQGKNLDFSMISLIFLFLLDPDKNLGFLCRNLLGKLIASVRSRVRRNARKIQSREKIVENSVEYSLVYLISVFLNNPFFLEKDHSLNYSLIFKFLTEFVKLFDESSEKDLEKTDSAMTAAFPFEVILRSLQSYSPVDFEGIAGQKPVFYSLKAGKKTMEAPEEKDSQGPLKKQNSRILLEIFRDFLEKKMKGFSGERNTEEVQIDLDFYERAGGKNERNMTELATFKREFREIMEKTESKKGSLIRSLPKAVRRKPEKSKQKPEKKDQKPRKHPKIS